MAKKNIHNEYIKKQDILDEFWRIRRRVQMMDDSQTADKILTGLYYAEQAVGKMSAANCSINGEFTVIDKKTGEEPDTWTIARKEEWAKNLLYCNIDSFAIMEDGTLILVDTCGNFAYCPLERFEVKWDDES